MNVCEKISKNLNKKTCHKQVVYPTSDASTDAMGSDASTDAMGSSSRIALLEFLAPCVPGKRSSAGLVLAPWDVGRFERSHPRRKHRNSRSL